MSVLDVEAFLSAHGPMETTRMLPDGWCVDGWRVTAFLGKGGSGEVYRAVHAGTGTVAALKLFSDDCRYRFETEVRGLRMMSGQPHFPRFYGSGSCEKGLYLAEEFLEEQPLPSGDREIAAYLLAVCDGVAALHARGVVHRDMKPANILRRSSGELVIVDLGLLKTFATWKGQGRREDGWPVLPTVLDGRAVGAGTPGYAAPEQLTGSELTPQCDVHAVGMLAETCWSGKMPRVWRRIVRRATSAVPSCRYRDMASLARAIRGRNMGRNATWSVGGLLALTGVIWGWNVWGAERWRWYRMVQNDRVFRVERVLLETHLSPFKKGQGQEYELVYRNQTNEIDMAQIDLRGEKMEFRRPVWLTEGREYLVKGPGVLTAELVAPAVTTVRLQSCILQNGTLGRKEAFNVRYILDGHAGLSFPNLPPEAKSESCFFVLPFDGALNRLTFGP